MTRTFFTPKTRRNLYRILPFGFIWLISGWVFLIVEIAVAGSVTQLPATAIKMDFQIFILSSLAMASVGLLTGFIELKYLEDLFASKNFALRFIYKLSLYSLLFLIIVFLTFPIAVSLELNASILDQRVWNKYLIYFTSITHLSTVVQLSTALILSLFYAEISEFTGQGVLSNFFTGKYHTPIEEERVFMFLDMKSSTTIAEQLGHLAYFKLLRAYYDCFTDAIIEQGGEIYQYVGDEIILSWKFQAHKTDNRPLECFFAMKEQLNKSAPWFAEQFGIVPTFKAGIHYGKITTGEIGTIKKDMLFTGDVLNVTARIQSLCNSYQVDLIVSADMLQQLEIGLKYDAGYLGTAELRGKEEKKELYTVRSKKIKQLHFQLERPLESQLEL